ncbi:MAG: dehydro coenzyme reductase / coenzyme F420-0:L-glutamate ligase / coenzyme [Frankiaceae bacterium]|nr:dehydro coenzyme reductase / coenzyme F420-0:L-glutamate ligase / coenzyme [Frankiaceae bacterium]
MIRIWGVGGIPQITAGDDLARIIATAEPSLADGDIVVVTSKIVSKSEGRLVDGDTRDAAIDAETVRVVAQRGGTRIVETRHGLILAAAGVDASNVPAGKVALLPADPDGSAASLRAGLRAGLGVDVGVLITDTMGRPWRNGLVDVAIGAAGVAVLDDHRGRTDEYGHTLEMTVTALADEIAAAAELVKGKLDGVPVAVVRGLGHLVGDLAGQASDLIRKADEDLFRWGSREAVLAALDARGPDTDGVVLVPVAGAGNAVERVLACAPDGDPIRLVAAGAALERLALRLAADGIGTEVAAPADGDAEAPAGLVVVARLLIKPEQ